MLKCNYPQVVLQDVGLARREAKKLSDALKDLPTLEEYITQQTQMFAMKLYAELLEELEDELRR